MRALILIVLSICALTLTSVAGPQSVETQIPLIVVASADARTEGPVTHLVGKVVVKTDGIMIEADEVDLNISARYLEARGNVFVRHLTSDTTASNGNGFFRSVDAQIAQLRTQLQSLRVNLTDQNPTVMQVQEKIAALEAERTKLNSDPSTWSIHTDALKMQILQSKP